ncbi:MAG: CHRD domain-containing protein [Burkholderiaceae bacterium]
MNSSRPQFRPLIGSALLISALALAACSTVPETTQLAPSGMQISSSATKQAPSSAPESPASFSVMTMLSQLTGKNEVPPNASAGTGSVDARYNTRSNLLSWTITYRGLTGPLTGAHLHGPAAAGQNAGVVVPFTGSIESPIVGSTTLTPSQAADLMAGKWYVNLHTAAYPGGEIRGQVTLQP